MIDRSENWDVKYGRNLRLAEECYPILKSEIGDSFARRASRRVAEATKDIRVVYERTGDINEIKGLGDVLKKNLIKILQNN